MGAQRQKVAVVAGDQPIRLRRFAEREQEIMPGSGERCVAGRRSGISARAEIRSTSLPASAGRMSDRIFSRRETSRIFSSCRAWLISTTRRSIRASNSRAGVPEGDSRALSRMFV